MQQVRQASHAACRNVVTLYRVYVSAIRLQDLLSYIYCPYSFTCISSQLPPDAFATNRLFRSILTSSLLLLLIC